jgi:hypothetical protein
MVGLIQGFSPFPYPKGSIMFVSKKKHLRRLIIQRDHANAEATAEFDKGNSAELGSQESIHHLIKAAHWDGRAQALNNVIFDLETWGS